VGTNPKVSGSEIVEKYVIILPTHHFFTELAIASAIVGIALSVFIFT